MKKQPRNDIRWVQNSRTIRPVGIGGEFACPLPQIANGGPKAKGRLSRLMGSHRRTSMSRPHVTRVSRTETGRSRELNNRGNRSGRERSSPTWGHGCRGVTGRRKPVDLAHGYEGPPSEFPPPQYDWFRCRRLHLRTNQVPRTKELQASQRRLPRPRQLDKIQIREWLLP